MQRRSAETYRNWTIDEWCDHVRKTGVQSLAQWAERSRSSYNHALALGVQRTVADALGWHSKPPNGAMRRWTNEDFAQKFRRYQVHTITDMQLANNAWCTFLRREGRFAAVRKLLNVDYVTERHEPTVEYFVARARRFDFFEGWCCAERCVAGTARRLGLFVSVRDRCPRRKTRWFNTTGGCVHSLPELVVARLLEANSVVFETEPAYPFHVEGRRIHPARADFYLPKFDLWIEIWGMRFRDQSARGRVYRRRRIHKVGMCNKIGIRLVGVDGWQLFRCTLPDFVAHVRRRVSHCGPALHICDVEARDLFSLNCLGNHRMHRSRRT